jgi:V/A-type H+-transporting ATPase subunit I
MIAQLKKFTFLVYHREYNELLDMLREAGVVHIIDKGRGTEEDPAAELIAQLRRYDNVIRVVKRSLPEDDKVSPPQIPPETEPEEVIATVENLLSESEELKSRIQALKSEAAKIEAWGEYEQADFEKLLKTGWQISLFTCPSKRFSQEWHNRYSIQVINVDRGKTYFAVVHKPGEVIELDADPERIGERSAPKLMMEATAAENRLQEIKTMLTGSSTEWLKYLKEGRTAVLNKVEYITAEHQAVAEADGKLMILQGWIPADHEEEVMTILEDRDVYYYESDPEPGENVPVMLRNNNFSRLFEPISRLFALPDYRELDLTPFFAPFFMLFFGFCLGDAGYGLLFIALAFIMYKRVPRDFRPYLSLAKYLGISTVLFGLISGTFFGMNLIDSGYRISDASITQMKSYKVPDQVISGLLPIKGERFETRKGYLSALEDHIGPEALAESKTALLKSAEGDFSLIRSFRHMMQDSISMFYLAILIGALQIIFGMIVKIINITIQRGFKYSLSTVGWVLLILTMIVFKGGEAAGIINGEAAKPVMFVFMGIAGVLIFLLNNLSINVFLRIGSGVWDTYNVATGIFGDLLSYIRLFALGISSAILGFVFNDISSQFLSIPYIGWLPFVLLLVVGHSINIFMAALGGFIHPMRLTFVEFYKNAGFKGGGKEYKPFRINS